MSMDYNKKIVLEDGSEFYGYSFGANIEKVCELVFNTAMIGYQEVISDPSNTNQMVIMTYPLIGNYGITDGDYETKTPTIGGLIVREYNDMPSNFRYTKTLAEVMEEYDIPGIEGIDTRSLARKLKKGTVRGIITFADTPVEKAVEVIKNTPVDTNVVSKVSCKKLWYSRTSNHLFNVVAIDCGIRLSIVRALNSIGCNVTVVPFDTTPEQIDFMKPDGIVISNGPGNPQDAFAVVETIKSLKGKYPIFGIDLGNQLIALAYGGKIVKMNQGHHGSNHPVKNLKTGDIETCLQNHIYVIDEASLKNTDLTVTYTNVLDNTVEGIACEKDNIFGVQYIPEIISGPNGRKHLYGVFFDKMKEVKDNAKKN
ncbi:MAG: glutamine-hydrolyzing carbamoyl-phosphate synthase small subunit [Clostridia bacterium]|nr:glutamine-hydrolyzing carbamoyl-phosphate synthase small subunit [Clostridia bacterium]